jgi:Ca-activated chloride channel family protein
MIYEGEDEKFFLLMVQPPERVEIEDIPPREYVFVVDVSGSMNGYPLNTAKKLLKDLIGGLRKTDKFNLVLFAGASKLMASQSVQATTRNIRRAIRILDLTRGGGGTELSRGLERSFSIPRDETYSRTIVIVTDGYISAEKEVFTLIRENLNRTNVFSFGIGTSVNRYLIEGMAKAGLGEPFIVTEPDEAHLAVDKFREYVQSPVLTRISIQYQGLETYDIEPPSIPDLFAQRPIVVFGKWRGELLGTIELRGSGGRGPYVQTIDVTHTTPLEMNHALRYLWARTRISRLSDFNFNNGDSENQAQITSLGLTYNLLTPYTSFIAVHEEIRNPEDNSKDVKQPLPLPKGVSNSAVGASCSNVPEPELTLMFGILATILASLFCLRKLRRECSANIQRPASRI